MAFIGIKRVLLRAKLRKAHKHYKSDPIQGERCYIQREGKATIEVLFYYPKIRENMPVFIQVHGGGWLGCDAVDDDLYCARLAEELNAFVVNLNYKRIYEEGFPYQEEETVDVVKWLKANARQMMIDPDRIVISGGSAGGHIVAGAAIMLSQANITVAGQLLEVPFLDFLAEGFKDLQLLNMMFELYPSKLPLEDPVISPGSQASDEILKKVAPACVIVCGRDPLQHQGEHYAKRLQANGKLLELKKYENGYHGFNTDKAEEKPEQLKLREECFQYKVRITKQMFGVK